MKIIYRISDGGYNKIKPEYVTKRGIFLHFIKIFSGYDIYLIADNISDDTFNFLCNYIPSNKINRTALGNAGSFMYAINFAIKNFNDNDKVYLCEDDYVYVKEAPSILEEGIDIAHYCTGYDHPDKYINYKEGGGNPYISEGGELTRVIMSKNKHWKHTNSTTMTFGTKVKILKLDLDIYIKYCSGNHPYDFQMFCELINSRKRILISSIPGISTHGETANLSRLIDWSVMVL